MKPENWKIGFIGLGNMGKKMAQNLIKNGFPVVVHDKDPNAYSEFKNVGKTVEDVVEQGNLIVTMLPTGKDVESVLLDGNIITSRSSSGKYFINCSTVSPSTEKKIHAIAKTNNAIYLDAPVSGGTLGAQQGTLTFMLGGSKHELPKIKPVLMAMGKNIIHCGDVGSGQVAKLCNNMILGGSTVVLSEAMGLAIRQGLDPIEFMKIVNTSTGRSWSSEKNCPVPGYDEKAPSSNGYQAGFSLALIVKDLLLAQEMARSSSSDTEIADAVLSQYLRVSKKDDRLDFSAVYLNYIKDQKGNDT